MNQIQRIKKKLETNGWRKDAYGIDYDDKVCLMGAYNIVVGKQVDYWHSQPTPTIKALAEGIKEYYSDRITDPCHRLEDVVISFNDHEHTTYDDVVNLLDKVA